MAGLLANTAQSYKSWVLLLKLSLQIGTGVCTIRGWVEAIYQDPKRVAFEARVQVIILCRAVIDAKARADYRLLTQRAGCPG